MQDSYKEEAVRIVTPQSRSCNSPEMEVSFSKLSKIKTL